MEINMRIKPTQQQRKELFEFYGDGCVVCGPMDKNKLDIAHIDDNSRNTVFENLLPLRSDLNQALSRSKEKSKPDLPDELQPISLSAKAMIHFRNGHYAAAYGCNRLGCHLAITRQNDYNLAVELLAYCISALRPISQKYLLRHVILLAPVIMKKSPESIDPFWKAEFLERVGLVLCDFNKLDLSNQVQQVALKLYEKSSNSPWRSDVELKKAAAIRRYALVNFDSTTFDKLIEIEEIFQKRGDYTGEVITLHTKAVLQFELKNDIKKTKDTLEKMKKLEPKTNNPWVLAELHFLLGRIHILLGEKKKAKDEFEISRQLFLKHKIIPEPSRNIGELDPSRELRKLGVNTEYLLPNRGEFFLSNEELCAIVNRVIKL
jgi:tetratricopeptide (TPR) repeat protein